MIIIKITLDDYNSFKEDIEICIKSYSKIRGKRAQSVEFLEFFNALMEESFPSEEPVEVVLDETISKKRGRLSTESADAIVSGDGTDKPDKKKSTAAKITEPIIETQEVTGTTISSSQKV
jgi:hypothetical protein